MLKNNFRSDFSDALDPLEERHVDDGPGGEEAPGQLGADVADILDAGGDPQHVPREVLLGRGLVGGVVVVGAAVVPHHVVQLDAV